MIRPDDLAHCRASIRTGSRSFHAASRLLPGRVRDPALALYAFCRLADDEVDEGNHKSRALQSLHDRLALAYAGTPRNAPEDRAFAAIVEEFGIPRALPEALLEGLSWDAEGRRYASLSAVRAYAARVASAVGAMMCVLMGVRDPDALARACDLGVAMQLTNIARDVGEDARAGRIYLPLDWLAEAGLCPEDVLNADTAAEALRDLVRRLLDEARVLYRRSDTGVAALPRRVRPGIYCAHYLYAGIGSQIARNGYDTVTRRAHTGPAQKLGWVWLAACRAGLSTLTPRSPLIYVRALDEVQFLVDAARGPEPRSIWGEGRTGAFLAAMATLKARDNGVKNPYLQT